MLMTIYKRAFAVLMKKPLKLWGISLLFVLLSSVLGTLCGAAIPALAPLFVGLVQVAFYEEITATAVCYCSGCGCKLTSEVPACPNCGKTI